MRKKVAFMVTALLAGTLMLPDHDAFARGGFHGGGGFVGFHAGGGGFRGFHGGGFGDFRGGRFGGSLSGFGGFRSGRSNRVVGGFHGRRVGRAGRFGRGLAIYGFDGDYLYGYPCDPYGYDRCYD